VTCVLCARRQPDVGYLCAVCHDRLAQQLLDVQREAELLSAVPSMQQAAGTRSGTLASHRSPARLDVLVLTDPRTAADEHGTLGLLGVLGSWARIVREDRDLRIDAAVTVASERKLLSVHLQWIAAQPWVDEFAAEVSGLLRQMQRANGTQPDPPAGRCYLPTDSGASCDGPIWVDHAAGHAHCSWCRNTWDGHDLHRLALILEQQEAEAEREARRPRTHDGRPMLTADELVSRGYVSSVSNVRVRAHRLGVTAVDGHYDPAALTPCKASA
jgi:hypothetical protein